NCRLKQSKTAAVLYARVRHVWKNWVHRINNKPVLLQKAKNPFPPPIGFRDRPDRLFWVFPLIVFYPNQRSACCKVWFHFFEMCCIENFSTEGFVFFFNVS